MSPDMAAAEGGRPAGVAERESGLVAPVSGTGEGHRAWSELVRAPPPISAAISKTRAGSGLRLFLKEFKENNS